MTGSVNIAAEGLEMEPDHSSTIDCYNWRPHIDRLSLGDYMNTIPGIELTGSRSTSTASPSRLTASCRMAVLPSGTMTRASRRSRCAAIKARIQIGWIQFNHPDLTNMFFDRDMDGVADGGFVGVGSMIDGAESQNGNDGQASLKARLIALVVRKAHSPRRRRLFANSFGCSC